MLDAEAFLDEVLKKYRLTINNSFRTYDEQMQEYAQYLTRGRTGNPVARPGHSRHESGFAFDLNGLRSLTFNSWNNLLNTGQKYGFEYLLGDFEGNAKFDWPHFQADPSKLGLTIQEVIYENRVARRAIAFCGGRE